MDYSKLSDFEINKRVLALKSEIKPLAYPHNADERSAGMVDINGAYHWFDFCNNPAKAWPILFKNLIGIEPLYQFDDEDEETSGGIHPDGEWEACHVRNNGIAFRSEHCNPLRAAMIVYLMMQEGE